MSDYFIFCFLIKFFLLLFSFYSLQINTLFYKNDADYQRIQRVKDGRRRLNECEKACAKKSNCGYLHQDFNTDQAEIRYGCGAYRPTYLREKLGILVRTSEKEDDREVCMYLCI